MIDNLLPANIATLRELYKAVYADRPELLQLLLALLEDLEETVWDGDDSEGTYTSTFDYVNDRMLSLLLEAGDVPADQAADAVAATQAEWRMTRPGCIHPARD